MSPIITLQNISKTFTEKSGQPLLALQGINLDIRAGEFFVILGPSGSGKSTLLRIMSGLEKTYAGQVSLSADIRQADISFVFQRFALLPWMTVEDNVRLWLRARNLDTAALRARVADELKLFGLEKFAHARPKELSGGMRQRVGLARALATQPKIMFMDEPFSELDSFTAQELRTDLLQIWLDRKMTIVMVTHNIDEALELADRVAVLTPRPGRIENS